MRTALLSALLLVTPPALAQDDDSKAQSMQQRYLTYLKGRGLTAEVDADGDVRFSMDREGRTWTYFIDVDANDSQFMAIVLPNIWPIESEPERVKVLRAVDATNAKIKVAKAHTMSDNVWISAELFVSGPDQYASVFDRSLTVIHDSADRFVSEMKK